MKAVDAGGCRLVSSHILVLSQAFVPSRPGVLSVCFGGRGKSAISCRMVSEEGRERRKTCPAIVVMSWVVPSQVMESGNQRAWPSLMYLYSAIFT